MAQIHGVPSLEVGQDILDNIRDMLSTASAQNDADSEAWRIGMVDFGQSLSVPELSLHAHSLLLAAPHGELADNLRFARLYQKSGASIRYTRKLFMIARDGITASCDEQADLRYTDLFSLCHSLGKIADSRGTDRNYIDIATAANEQLGRVPIEPQQPSSEKAARDRLLANAYAAYALDTEDYVSADAYHRDRKAFRRSVHVATLEAAATGDTQLTQLAIDGIVLNREYGSQKDAMYAIA